LAGETQEEKNRKTISENHQKKLNFKKKEKNLI